MARFRTWTPGIDPLAGFAPVMVCGIPCEDVWPPGSLCSAARAAYDHLAARGEIEPLGVRRDERGRISVRYRAKIPHAWQREELGREKQKLLEGEIE